MYISVIECRTIFHKDMDVAGLVVSPTTSPSNAMRYNYYHNQSDDIYGGQISPVSAQQLSDGSHMMAGADGKIYNLNSAEMMVAQQQAAAMQLQDNRQIYYYLSSPQVSQSPTHFFYPELAVPTHGQHVQGQVQSQQTQDQGQGEAPPAGTADTRSSMQDSSGNN